jgi:GNAT superfamily N-acetyltransferase
VSEPASTELEIRDEAYDSPSAALMMPEIQAEYVTRYGGHDSTPVDPSEFAPPTGCFLVGYLADVPVAMGGFRRRTDGEVEIKRMFVARTVRGRGFSRQVLEALEDRARELRVGRIVLETGQKQPEAIRLYTTSGYLPIEGFGHYRCAPLSLSFAKLLG